MSANRDTQMMVTFATNAGLEVVKSKHGGYGCYDGEDLICMIHTGGNQPRNWMKATRRKIDRWLARVSG